MSDTYFHYLPDWRETVKNPVVFNVMMLMNFRTLWEKLSIHLNSLEIRHDLSLNHVVDLGDPNAYFVEEIKRVNGIQRVGVAVSGTRTPFPQLPENDLVEAGRIIQACIRPFEE